MNKPEKLSHASHVKAYEKMREELKIFEKLVINFSNVFNFSRISAYAFACITWLSLSGLKVNQKIKKIKNAYSKLLRLSSSIGGSRHNGWI